MAHSEVIKNEFLMTIPYTSESKQATNSASVDDFVTSFCLPGSSSVVVALEFLVSRSDSRGLEEISSRRQSQIAQSECKDSSLEEQCRDVRWKSSSKSSSVTV
jgi:hypothetical protein